jgi:two-component system osmolarity sensor histidine kinase EnvZ
MFYGLSKFIKEFLPKRLFYRSLLIVAAPIILLQLTITIVFFDSLWIKANTGMTRSLVSEIITIIDVYNNENEENKKIITDLYNQNFNFSVRFIEEETLPKIQGARWFSPMDRTLRRELKSQFIEYWFDSTTHKEVVDLKIKFNNGVLQILFPKERITPSSARIFALWITLPAFLLILIAILFLRNQTRPIVNLAKAAEKFGKGDYIEEFRPSGAMEIRQAGHEFDRMRKRITRHLNQRSEMLSGISHDLRTPLTRLKLQLSFLKDKVISKKMANDIDDMEKMLNDYLQFASSQINEKTETFEFDLLLKEIVSRYEHNKINLSINDKITFNGRLNSIKRCINNLLNNAVLFGKEINVTLRKTMNNIIIFVDDDGPGIPEHEKENVLKPFYRMDESRSQNKSGVGLGLSISYDIIRSHGGDMLLETSPQKGLRVKISLPS